MFWKRKRDQKKAPKGKQIIPDSAWEGQSGDMLRALGKKPDDPSNFTTTADDISARLKTLQENEAKFIAQMQAQLPPSVELAPFAMIPFDCWMKGPHSNFLYYVLDMMPFGPWNLLLLPANDRSSLVLDMTVAPKGVSAQHVEIANNFIKQAEAKVMAAKAETERLMAQNDMNALDGFTKEREKAIAGLMTLAMMLGKEIIGKESFVKSRQMFFGDGELAAKA